MCGLWVLCSFCLFAGGSDHKTAIIVGSVVGGVVAIGAALGLYFYCKKKDDRLINSDAEAGYNNLSSGATH